jgi:hypothetical protein
VLKLLNKLSSCAPTIATKSYAALVQNHNLVGKRHGLHLFMGHIDHGGFQILVSLASSSRIYTRSSASRFDMPGIRLDIGPKVQFTSTKK